MIDLDIELPVTLDPDAVPSIVEEVFVDEGLNITMRTTLKSYPGCTHWHLKSGIKRGILEVTWWPRVEEASRLWLSVHGNRTADWIEPLKPRLKELLEAQLATRFADPHPT